MCGSVALPSSADISRVQPWVSCRNRVVLIGMFLSSWFALGGACVLRDNLVGGAEKRERVWQRERRLVRRVLFFLRQRLYLAAAFSLGRGRGSNLGTLGHGGAIPVGSTLVQALPQLSSSDHSATLSGARCVTGLHEWSGRWCGELAPVSCTSRLWLDGYIWRAPRCLFGLVVPPVQPFPL